LRSDRRAVVTLVCAIAGGLSGCGEGLAPDPFDPGATAPRPATGAVLPEGVTLYDRVAGLVAAATIGNDGTVTTLALYSQGFDFGWDTVEGVGGPDSTLFYGRAVGSLLVERNLTNGSYEQRRRYDAGAFGTWTHIVRVDGASLTLCYDADSGGTQWGSFDEAGAFHRNGTASIGTGWTSVTGLAGSIEVLFYRKGDGAYALVRVGTNTIATELTGSLAPGWTHVVTFSDGGAPGLLFYNAVDGSEVSGLFQDGAWVDKTVHGPFKTGWTHILRTGAGELFFYDSAEGSGATELVSFTRMIDQSYFEPGTFHAGWTGIANDLALVSMIN